jgi:hypothetical protein
LLIKSFWWAAWWPVSTWLLMVEKAASQTLAQGAGRQQHRACREWGRITGLF